MSDGRFTNFAKSLKKRVAKILLKRNEVGDASFLPELEEELERFTWFLDNFDDSDRGDLQMLRNIEINIREMELGVPEEIKKYKKMKNQLEYAKDPRRFAYLPKLIELYEEKIADPSVDPHIKAHARKTLKELQLELENQIERHAIQRTPPAASAEPTNVTFAELNPEFQQRLIAQMRQQHQRAIEDDITSNLTGKAPPSGSGRRKMKGGMERHFPSARAFLAPDIIDTDIPTASINYPSAASLTEAEIEEYERQNMTNEDRPALNPNRIRRRPASPPKDENYWIYWRLIAAQDLNANRITPADYRNIINIIDNEILNLPPHLRIAGMRGGMKRDREEDKRKYKYEGDDEEDAKERKTIGELKEDAKNGTTSELRHIYNREEYTPEEQATMRQIAEEERVVKRRAKQIGKAVENRPAIKNHIRRDLLIRLRNLATHFQNSITPEINNYLAENFLDSYLFISEEISEIMESIPDGNLKRVNVNDIFPNYNIAELSRRFNRDRNDMERLRDAWIEHQQPPPQPAPQPAPQPQPPSGSGRSSPDYKVQSVLFKRPSWTEQHACSWLAQNGFKNKGVDVKKDHFRFRQLTPSYIKKLGYTHFVTKTLPHGIDLIIAYKK